LVDAVAEDPLEERIHRGGVLGQPRAYGQVLDPLADRNLQSPLHWSRHLVDKCEQVGPFVDGLPRERSAVHSVHPEGNAKELVHPVDLADGHERGVRLLCQFAFEGQRRCREVLESPLLHLGPIRGDRDEELVRQEIECQRLGNRVRDPRLVL